MGREVRRVPANWQHPKDENGQYIGLMENFNECLRDWEEQKAKWDEGMRTDFKGGWEPIEGSYRGKSYEEWNGKRPEKEDYMPEFTEEEKTHLQMYETCTEGTPISPVMDSPEKLARWLADNGASAFGNMTATYEQWLQTCLRGWAPSAIAVGGKLRSGVEMS